MENWRKKNAQLTGIRQSTVPSSRNQEARLKNESVTRKSKGNNRNSMKKNANLPEFADLNCFVATEPLNKFKKRKIDK